MSTHLTPYGMVLAFDGYYADSAACNDPDLLREVLESLPEKIGMRPLGSPHLVAVDEPGIQGLSGFRFIMESHISIHTYAERGFVTADIYSCKSFDAELASQYLAEAFSLTDFETQTLLRGLRFNEVRPHMRS